MGRAVVRGGFDTYSGSANPSREFYGSRELRLQNGVNRAYLYFKVPAPRGSIITSATLRVHASGASTGARTVTAARVAASWKVARLNWNNQPGVVAGTDVAAAIGTVADRDPIDFDVTAHVQSMVNGAANHGWRLVTTAASMHRLYSLDAARSKPTLTVEWAEAPAAPTTLSPSDSVISVDKPTVQFDYTDTSGPTSLVAVQVQVDPAANTTTPAFDSGEVATTEPELALASTAYTGLADGASTQWRVRVKDVDGLWSAWSDWTTITRHVKPAVTISNPAAGASPFVTETTPPVIWSFTGQLAWQVRVTPASDRAKILYDSGKQGGTATSHTLPAGVLKEGETFSVQVRCWDRTDREATPGDPTYAYLWRDFTVTDDPAVLGPTTLTVAQDGFTPWVVLTWTRATAPDSFAVVRDGATIQANLDPADVLVSGTTYQWVDHTAAPLVEHTYSVRAVVNGTQSQVGPTQWVTTDVTGIWLVDLDQDVHVVLAGDDDGSWEMVDDATVYNPLGSTVPVRVVTGMRGLEGQLSGLLIDGMADRGYTEQEADLWTLKERPSANLRLVVSDVNIQVLAGDLVVTPTQHTREGDPVKNVSFSFWQTGQLPFTPRL